MASFASPVQSGRHDSPHPQHDEFEALSDRLLFAEAALHHVCDRLGIDTHDLPDPTVDRLVAVLLAWHERFDSLEQKLDLVLEGR
jgi:hypothetical protein